MTTFIGTVAPRRIAVFRALQLGDLLCSVPALRALRTALPDAHMTLIGLPWAHAFAARYADLIDAFEAFPGARGFPEQPEDESGPAVRRQPRLEASFSVAVCLRPSRS